MKSAFDVILNKNVPRSTITNAEMLGAYCDRLLKTGSGDTRSDEQTERMLKDIVQLFSYLQDKDFFGEIHKNYLAKRLLNNRSKSDDLEKSMIGHLKIECGAQFTQPLEVRDRVSNEHPSSVVLEQIHLVQSLTVLHFPPSLPMRLYRGC